MSAPPELPEIVTRAFDVSRRAGYVSFCRNETGRLLATLAATREGTMAEFGTGCGVGTAWLRSGVRGADARILTAELDPKLAEAAAEIFRDDDQVEVLAADWSTLLRPRALLAAVPGLRQALGVAARPGRRADGRRRDRRPRRLHALPVVAADLRRPRRHPARGVAQRRPLRRRRGAGRPRRLGAHRHQALTPRRRPRT